MAPTASRVLTTAACILALGAAPAATAFAKPAVDNNRPPAPSVVVTADNETPVLYDSDEGGNASGDDPAIWVHPTNSADSIVVVTAKEGGLRVYDLKSQELQSLAATAFPHDGRYNNVDIAYGVTLAGKSVDLAVVSDRYNDTLRFFAIDPAGAKAGQPLTEVTATAYEWLFVGSEGELEDEHTAYGLAVWQPAAGGTYAVVTQEGTTAIAIAELQPRTDGTVGYRVVRTLELPATFPLPDGTTWTPCEEPGVGPQFEGVSVDQATGVLYAAQEDVGLWRIDLVGGKEPVLIDRTRDFGIHDAFDEETEECEPVAGQPSEDGNPYGGTITADAEGVDVYYGPGRTGYVILSSQGSDEFMVYSRQGNNRLVGSFRVDGVGGADEINGSDGLAVTNRPVGQFTEGLLVTHDEPETGPGVDEEQDPTNFSYVSWGDIARALGLPLNAPSLRADNDPRFR